MTSPDRPARKYNAGDIEIGIHRAFETRDESESSDGDDSN